MIEVEGLEIHEEDGEIERILAPDVGVQLERSSSRSFFLLLTLPDGNEVTVQLEAKSPIEAWLE